MIRTGCKPSLLCRVLGRCEPPSALRGAAPVTQLSLALLALSLAILLA